jgi:kynureninase
MLSPMQNGLEAAAAAADRADPAPARDRFAVTGVAYFAGNSLGLMPLAATAAVGARLDEWMELGVEAWFESGWLEASHDLAPAMARVVGARASEVAIAGSLTQNLHFLLAALYRPTAERYRILIDADAFPSDQYAVATHVAWHGLDPADAVLHGTGDRVDASVAVTLRAGASYISGEVADVEARTAQAHAAGAIAIWDMAHAAGNVPLALHDWDVDAAAWCGYKYLNGGPGAPAALFVAERHCSAPRLAGWWGVAPERRFKMEPEFVPRPGAEGFVVSTPSILALAPLAASLAEFDRVGMDALVARSGRLTEFLEAAVTTVGGATKVTPTSATRRGCQLSVYADNAKARCARLRHEHSVVCDFREPNVLRFAPVPLYSTYVECARAARALAAIG